MSQLCHCIEKRCFYCIPGYEVFLYGCNIWMLVLRKLAVQSCCDQQCIVYLLVVWGRLSHALRHQCATAVFSGWSLNVTQCLTGSSRLPVCSSARTHGHTVLFTLPEPAFICLIAHPLACTYHTHAHTHTQGSRPQQQWYRITFFPVSTAEIYGFSLYCFSATAWHWLTLLTWHYSDASVTFTVHSRLSAFLLGLSIVMLDLATHHKAHLPALVIELSCSVCNPLQAMLMRQRGSTFTVCKTAHWYRNLQIQKSISDYYRVMVVFLVAFTYMHVILSVSANMTFWKNSDKICRGVETEGHVSNPLTNLPNIQQGLQGQLNDFLVANWWKSLITSKLCL